VATEDPLIYGESWYIGASFGVDGIPVVDLVSVMPTIYWCTKHFISVYNFFKFFDA